MLYPQHNPFRQFIDLSGYWDFCIDPDGAGESKGWFDGINGRPIAVPASWNDQFAEWRDYLDDAWYETRFNLPWGWEDKQVFIRFGSVNYLADVWLNGIKLGTHEGGHLAFAFEATSLLKDEDNVLVVRVNGAMAVDRVPPGRVQDPLDSHKIGLLPDTTFDFFPFAGIQRPVLLTAVPQTSIEDITVTTEIEGENGRIKVKLEIGGWRVEGENYTARISINEHEAGIAAETVSEPFDKRKTRFAELTIPNANLWSPKSPHLYDLVVELLENRQIIDRYTLPIGIRTVDVVDDKLLLNGEPIFLRGFGRHEDFPITGRGVVPAVNIKDYALLDWIGANSFRTSHYPYDEEALQLADRLGYLVISETAAVGLFFQEEGMERRLELCRQYTQELINRDKNHPSVIAWSLANEARSVRGNEVPFFRNLYDLAKELDPTRPITIVSDLFTAEASFAFFDIVCLNIYRGWYQEMGRLEAGLAEFGRILDAAHAAFGKPIIVTEFGADAIPGHHALPPEMFSEEYQADFIEGYLGVMGKRPFIVGQHVWNMCDFKTAQGVKRPNAINYKGVFTRDRRPKLAAHRLKKLWGLEAEH